MKKQNYVQVLCLGVLLSAGMVACDSKEEEAKPAGKYSDGVFVLNEGNFGRSNSSVTFYNPQSKTAVQDIFKAENTRTLGDVAQSMTIHKGKAYIVVNNSSKVEIVDSENFKSIASVESGVKSPRFVAIVNDRKAYISNWGTDDVAVLDLNTNQVIKSVKTGRDPEGILIVNNEAWIADSGNEYGSQYDNRVTVINTQNDQVVTTLTVQDVPLALKLDANNKIWLLCSGKPSWVGAPTPANLLRIDPSTKTIEKTITFTNGFKPGSLEISGDRRSLFIGDGSKVFKMAIMDNALPANPLIKRNFYGMSVNPANDEIYTTDALDYSQKGLVFRFKSTGEKIDSVKVGLIPNGVYFRQ